MKRVVIFLCFFLMPAFAAAQVPLSGARTSAPASPSARSAAMNDTNTQLQMRIEEAERTMQEYISQIEAQQNEIRKLNTRIDKLSADIDVRFSLMEKKLAEVKDAPPPPPPASKPAAKGSGSGSAASPASESEKDPQALYNRAHDSIRAGKYEQAEGIFARFLALYPNHDLAGNAQYWLGETYYVRADYEHAAIAFAEGFKKYRKNTKGPDNLLKLGLSMQQLGQKKEACSAFNNLKKEFPDASEDILKRTAAARKKADCGAAQSAADSISSKPAAPAKPSAPAKPAAPKTSSK